MILKNKNKTEKRNSNRWPKYFVITLKSAAKENR